MFQISAAPWRISTWFHSMESMRIDAKRRHMEVARAKTRANAGVRSNTWGRVFRYAVVSNAFIAWPALALSSSGWIPPAPSESIVITASRVRAPRPPSPPPDLPTIIPLPACSGFLPPGLTVQPSGATLFWYRLMPGGDVHDASLFRSSGNSDLDKAALACANSSHRPPEIVAGKPAEILWVGGVDWSIANPVFGEPTPNGKPNQCRFFYPPRAIRLNQQGTTVVGFRIAADGTVKDEIVAQSSGSSSLDNAAIDCVKSYRYFPANQNEQPVEIDRATRFIWRIQ